MTTTHARAQPIERNMSDNLQQISDDIRAELRRTGGWCVTDIAHHALKEPLRLDVRSDGVSAWLVTATCGDRVLFDTGHSLCVHPDEFLSGLYVFLRACIRALTMPAPKSN